LYIGVPVSAYATIDDLRSQLGAKSEPDPAYAAKMLHDVPLSTVVDRAQFILQKVNGKRVLEFGASGPMHDAIVREAAACLGVDREDGPGVVGFNLDDVSRHFLPEFRCDVIVCGEVLEHLSNPGWFLHRLKTQYEGVPVVITVPNAFAQAGRSHMLRGVENVNVDHVAWYSHRTLKTLLERVGYDIKEFHWYRGVPYLAEGLIVVTE
jgi:hypothetical protein